MAAPPHPGLERRRLQVRGIVQGVGFRPFVHALAGRHRLGGFVFNDDEGVVIEAEGDPGALARFTAALGTEAPALAQVGAITTAAVPPRGERRFAIAASRRGAGAALVPPDVATCDDCLRELFDPADRRCGHPFITCTQCGPRFTLVRRAPYDRATTTMAGFAMCARCRHEYEDPRNRRFHAETIACPACGPRLSMPVREAAERLRAGEILAVKGLGGYHLACRAGDEDAVARLRTRKRREAKPFAVMATRPGDLVWLDAAAAAILRAPQRPIVLARAREGASVAPSVAPGSPWLGVMLPYTPVHHLLLAEMGEPLVMTSGNRSDEPIAFDDRDARERLAGIADGFLGHDRPIHRRCEDSVVHAGDGFPFTVRRSRGHAPSSLPLPRAAARPIVAAGGELKSTFCVARGEQAFLSPHLGDLESPLARRAFGEDVALYLDMLGVTPDVVAHDLHPDYASTRWAQEQPAELVGVQHHHAHAAACLAEHGREGPALAVVFDGTGHGTDGSLWGGEVLRCDLAGFERVAHLAPVPLVGGAAAIRQPWRVAAAYLEAAGRPVPYPRWPLVRQGLAVNAPLSSGMGRLFDAVAALLDLRHEVTYEGQAAVELETLAGRVPARPYPCRIAGGRLVGADLVAAAHDDLAAGRDRAEIAAAFHEGVAAAATAACAAVGEPRVVVLSGGTFQNVRLRDGLRRRLEALGFEVLVHRLVPTNDGGISYGQAAIAARRTSPCA